MPQVDEAGDHPGGLGLAGRSSLQMGVGRGQALWRVSGNPWASWAEPGGDRKGTSLPSPRWLALSRLRELSSWLPW